MFIPVLFITAIVLAIIIGWFADKNHPYGAATGGVCTLGVGGLIIVVMWVGMALETTGGVIAMENYYDQSKGNNEYYVDQLRGGVPVHGNPAFLDAANLKQVGDFKKAVQHQVNDALRYNKKLAKYRRYHKSFWFGIMWANVPDRLEPTSLRAYDDN